MRTAQDWLQLYAKDKGEFEVEIAKVLAPGKSTHIRDCRAERDGSLCWKCGENLEALKGMTNDPCPVPDPINSSDLDGAIKLIRQLFTTPRQQSDFVIELVDICDSAPIDYLTNDSDFMLWLIFVATIPELLRAAAMAKEAQ